MSENQLDTIYDATSQAEQQATYDDWAAKYEQDLCAMGYRLRLWPPVPLRGLSRWRLRPFSTQAAAVDCKPNRWPSWVMAR